MYELLCFRVTAFLLLSLTQSPRSVRHDVSPKLLALAQNTLWQICLKNRFSGHGLATNCVRMLSEQKQRVWGKLK